MIDLTKLRTNFETTKALLLKKEPGFAIDQLRDLDVKLRELQGVAEELRGKKNELAKAAKGGVTGEQREQSIALGKELKATEGVLADVQGQFNALYLACPNIPQEDVPLGSKEENVSTKEVGQKPAFSFAPKNHVELLEALGWVDFETPVAMSGAQFVLYRGDGLRMLYALTNMMIKNNVKHGYEPVLPPYLVTEKALTNSGNLPKFADDLYQVSADGLYIIPTAEVPLTNLHAGKILPKAKLPVRNTAWTSCFRREAGGYGATERGMIRIHQFEKVELYSLVLPGQANTELEKMVACAEDILSQLGLHYRVSLLAGQDCSFSSSKTFDIEVWLPGQDRYYEVSSASNCTDFQARRAQIRYRDGEGAKPKLVHTLNASSLALPRLMVAIVECFQQEDGSIALPPVLREAMDQVW